MNAFTHLAPIAAASLASAIWQSALLVLCVAACLRLLPTVTAAARSALWTAVFLLTLLLPFAALVPASSPATLAPASLHVDPTWAFAVVALWAVLSSIRAAHLLRSGLRLVRIATRSTPITPTPDLAAILNSTPRRTVRLCTSAEVDVPSVIGFLRPRILLPPTLLASISPADLRQVILHELEHLRRRDDWTNLLQKLALVLFPLNPALLWVERRLCFERELACDDGVLRASAGATNGAAKAYATCLANLAEAGLLRRGLSLALGAWQRQSELTRRVHRILRNPARDLRPVHAAALASLTVAATLGAGLLAARSPQLISFTRTPVVEAAAAPVSAMPALHPTYVKATMPAPYPTPATLNIPRKPAHRNRTLALNTRRFAPDPDVVLVGWQPARWAAPPSFQLTYAAVPTRAGWLFFQL